MHISVKHGHAAEERCDLLVVGHFEGSERLTGSAAAADKALEGAITDLVKRDGFMGKLGERMIFPTLGKLPARKICLLGLGQRTSLKSDQVRMIGGHLIKAAREAKAKNVVTLLHGAGTGDLTTAAAAQALAEGIRLGAYRFHTYHGTGTKDHAQKKDVPDFTLLEPERAKTKDAERGLEVARVLAEATVLARDLVNTPSHDMTPKDLADAARSLAVRGSRIRCKVLDRDEMARLGMGAALAVAKGSDHPPVGVHLTYAPPRRSRKRVAVVGKAVTFDSGGLNIKSDQGMATMKADMAGAAAVIGLFKALPDLKPAVEVHGVFLAVENMPSGTAYRPGDIVRAMNGVTIEILNTDAEGRVTMADALSYVQKKIRPDMIVDVATLTGAAVTALGEEVTALMSNARSLTSSLSRAGTSVGETVWELPLVPSYEAALQSKIADINNTGGRGAGCIKAGFFLKRFVGDTPWAHLDIAGPSYCEKETRPDIPVGGTGVGVRLLAEWLRSV